MKQQHVLAGFLALLALATLGILLMRTPGRDDPQGVGIERSAMRHSPAAPVDLSNSGSIAQPKLVATPSQDAVTELRANAGNSTGVFLYTELTSGERVAARVYKADARPASFEGVTSSAGVIELSELPELRDVFYAVTPTHHGRLAIDPTNVEQTQLHVVLQPAGRIELSLPVAGCVPDYSGVDVFVLPRDGYQPRSAEEFERLPSSHYRVVSNASGDVTVAGLVPGIEYLVYAGNKSFASSGNGAKTVVKAADATPNVERIELYRVVGAEVQIAPKSLNVTACGLVNSAFVDFGSPERLRMAETASPPLMWTGLDTYSWDRFRRLRQVRVFRHLAPLCDQDASAEGGEVSFEARVNHVGYRGRKVPIRLGGWTERGFPESLIELEPVRPIEFGTLEVLLTGLDGKKFGTAYQMLGTLELSNVETGGRIEIWVPSESLPTIHAPCIPTGVYEWDFKLLDGPDWSDPSDAPRRIRVEASSVATVVVDTSAWAAIEVVPLLAEGRWHGPLQATLSGSRTVIEPGRSYGGDMLQSVSWPGPPYLLNGVMEGRPFLSVGTSNKAFMSVERLTEVECIRGTTTRVEIHLEPTSQHVSRRRQK